MVDTRNWKGELITFCERYSCSVPKYKSEQLLSTEWQSECLVEYPCKLIINSSNDDTKQQVITTSTKTKKRESQGAAAEAMISKLNRILAPYVLNIKNSKHIKKLKDEHVQNKILDTLESLFMDENIENSVFMQEMIQSNADQWIHIEKIMEIPIFMESLGKKSLNNDQYLEIKQLFIQMIRTKSDMFEVLKTSNGEYIRRKHQMENMHHKNEMKSEQLKLEGNKMFKDKKYKEAIIRYLDAMKYNCSDYKIAMNLSLVYLKITDLENAFKYANKAIQLQPLYGKPYARAAIVLFEMKQIQKAIATMDHAIRKQPNNQQYIDYQKEWKKSLL